MKKILAIVLAALMLCSALPFAAGAAVAKDDTAIDYLLNGDYAHLDYLNTKNHFKNEIAAYTAMAAYKDAWKNYVTKSVDIDNAEQLLLAVIDKIDAEYGDEIAKEAIAALEGVKNIADLVEKIDSYTHVLELAENSTWATSMTVLGNIIKGARYADELYEIFVDGMTAIMSAQAASEYYGAFLDNVAENANKEAVRTAAANIKANLELSYEEAVKQMLSELTYKASADGVEYGISIAMDAWSVTAIIKKVYNVYDNVVNKVFNTNEKYYYMSSLVFVEDIEKVTPAFVTDTLENGDTNAVNFALSAIITLRETGETMLANLGKVTEDGIVTKLLKNADYSEIKTATAKSTATLDLLRTIIEADTVYTTYAPVVYLTSSKDVAIYDGDEIVASIGAGTEGSGIAASYAYSSTYNSLINNTVTVVVPFSAGVSVEATANSSASTDSGSSSSGKKLNFFEKLIQAIKEVFAKLFSFGKK